MKKKRLFALQVAAKTHSKTTRRHVLCAELCGGTVPGSALLCSWTGYSTGPCSCGLIWDQLVWLWPEEVQEAGKFLRDGQREAKQLWRESVRTASRLVTWLSLDTDRPTRTLAMSDGNFWKLLRHQIPRAWVTTSSLFGFICLGWATIRCQSRQPAKYMVKRLKHE